VLGIDANNASVPGDSVDGNSFTCCNALQRTATHCNALQRTATHCNALQRSATHTTTQVLGINANNAAVPGASVDRKRHTVGLLPHCLVVLGICWHL